MYTKLIFSLFDWGEWPAGRNCYYYYYCYYYLVKKIIKNKTMIYTCAFRVRVSRACVACMCRLCVSRACVACAVVCLACAFRVRGVCRVCILRACVTCVPRTHIAYVCHVVCRMYVSRAHVACACCVRMSHTRPERSEHMLM